MSLKLEDLEKASTSIESVDAKSTKSEVLPSRGKERRKFSKKKAVRSAGSKPRLAGGGDAEDAAGEHNDEATGDGENGGDPDHGPPSPGSPQGSSHDPFTHQPLPTTGDAQVDEVLEAALHNLEEAGKALASLNENLEHELKLFLIELMGRTRKWASQVEGKMEWTRRDIVELHKELSSRVMALSESRRESTELRDQLANSEHAKIMAEQNSKNGLNADGSVRAGGGDGKSFGAARSVQLSSASKQCLADSGGKTPSCFRDYEGPMDPASVRAEEERLLACCADLECEVVQLRKENEKIVKERAEYENAIQRALLKGVSSLNVEALKVLRCTPIPQCCPPPPCPPPPCPPPTYIEPAQKSGCGSPSESRRRSSVGNCGGRSAGNGSREGLGGRKVCPSPGHESSRKKKRDSNMLLLLHQKDAENFGIQSSSNPCENATKKANVCAGGNCGKSGGRNQC